MKIRNGFVSNSSSSSFIIGIGKISDMSKASKLNEKSSWGKYIVRYEDIMLGLKTRNYLYEVQNDRIYVSSFSGASVSLPFDCGADYFIVDLTHGDEHEDFNSCDENGGWIGYNYDIDEDFFPEELRELLHLGEEQGLETYEATFGAGYNG